VNSPECASARQFAEDARKLLDEKPPRDPINVKAAEREEARKKDDARAEKKSTTTTLRKFARAGFIGAETDRAEVQIDLTSPPSIRIVEPVIQRAPGETRNAISSAISSGSP
jgi:hypothetical protein